MKKTWGFMLNIILFTVPSLWFGWKAGLTTVLVVWGIGIVLILADNIKD